MPNAMVLVPAILMPATSMLWAAHPMSRQIIPQSLKAAEQACHSRPEPAIQAGIAPAQATASTPATVPAAAALTTGAIPAPTVPAPAEATMCLKARPTEIVQTAKTTTVTLMLIRQTRAATPPALTWTETAIMCSQVVAQQLTVMI